MNQKDGTGAAQTDDMAGTPSGHILHTLNTPVEPRQWTESLYRTGEAAALDPHRSRILQQLLRQGLKQRKGLGSAVLVVGNVLQIHEGRPAGRSGTAEEGFKIPLLQGLALPQYPPVLLEEVVGPQHGPVSAGSADLRKLLQKSFVAYVPERFLAKIRRRRCP